MSIKALVLSHDPNRAFAENMTKAYDELWPEHPFQFYIPFQTNRTPWSDGLSFVPSAAGIKQSVGSLLELVGDEEMVYWAIDDKIPIKANQSRLRRLLTIFETLSESGQEEIDGLCFTRAEPFKKGIAPRMLAHGGNFFVRRLSYRGIWQHQLIRGRVLKNFWRQIIRASSPRDLDRYAWEPLPVDSTLLAVRVSALYQAEQARNGIPTAVATREALLRGILLPRAAEHLEHSDKDIFGITDFRQTMIDFVRHWRSGFGH
ncbi:unannotated protein [freshwater metagenome]|uniref:Unannotated protein n=1 Tax=freshwater metagenome TaxID=449393 RepID=A0A6J6JYW5_9ZZZZ